MNTLLKLICLTAIVVLAIVLLTRSAYPGGMACAIESNVPDGMPEPTREIIDSGMLEGIGDFSSGIGQLETLDLRKLMRKEIDPAERPKILEAAKYFTKSRANLARVLQECTKLKLPKRQTSDLEQLLSYIQSIEKSTKDGSYPDPNIGHDAIKLASKILAEAADRAVLHRGTSGHLGKP